MASDTAVPRTMFAKIWDRHAITQRPDGQTLLYVDRHLIHDGYAPAFEFLAARGLKPRVPGRIFGTPDHYVPTDANRAQLTQIADPERRYMVNSLYQNARASGIEVFGMNEDRQGIVHVIGPEQGLTQPGLLMVCGDSHTSTHGALGALAFGIGMTEVTHVLATQTLWQRRPLTMRITVDGQLATGVTAKDVILAIIAHIGAAGATGHVIEYAGSVISALSIEGRLTICNMSIEAGAKAGMIAPDEKTIAYLQGRPYTNAAAEHWKQFRTDDGAVFDQEVAIDGSLLEPMVTWGTSPQDAAPIGGQVPEVADPRALAYMGLQPGTPLQDIAIDRVFIGSCTNSRIEDLRAAAAIVKGRRAKVPAWVVPGSGLVKRQAEQEGLDLIFSEAGFEWRQPGCSMCLGTNGEIAAPGERCASTSNRNFAGRQGPGARTHLMSPQMAAAAAITGRLTDVREFLRGPQ